MQGASWLLRSGIRRMILSKKIIVKTAMVAGVLASLSSSCYAVDSMSFELATGNKTKMARIGAQWAWESRWWESGGTHIGGYWDFTLAQWRGTRFRHQPGATQNIT